MDIIHHVDSQEFKTFKSNSKSSESLVILRMRAAIKAAENHGLHSNELLH